ncbi:MAG TPA: tetraacyldisaccharide 4'-kinase [Verrucomicrobiae bacterium]|nr:tetraacyldisaccharide 4'-kinase [Verrucomicrobiae bacterium]
MTLRESLLWPFTLPYGAYMRLRARAYRSGIFPQNRLDAAVISVGNLTTGGTGKTPMVLWIAERLLTEGKSVGILTRGYRGEPALTGASGQAPVERTSDEVELLKARLGYRVAFGVGGDRLRRGRELVRSGVKWFVLDDGFQHLKLRRDLDIVLIDATNPFGGGHLLPAGRLREPRSALGRADIVVITRSSHAPAIEAVVGRESNAPIFYARTELDSVRRLGGRYPGEVDAEAPARRLFAFCGIGNPSAFVADLGGWGLQIVGRKFFADHHRYTQQDARAIEREAREAGAAAAICTEKDIHNLRGVDWPSFTVLYCRISLQVEHADQFWRVMMAALASRALPQITD